MLGPMESVDAPYTSALVNFVSDPRGLDDPLGTSVMPEGETALHFFDALSADTQRGGQARSTRIPTNRGGG